MFDWSILAMTDLTCNPPYPPNWEGSMVLFGKRLPNGGAANNKAMGNKRRYEVCVPKPISDFSVLSSLISLRALEFELSVHIFIYRV